VFSLEGEQVKRASSYQDNPEQRGIVDTACVIPTGVDFFTSKKSGRNKNKEKRIKINK